MSNTNENDEDVARLIASMKQTPNTWVYDTRHYVMVNGDAARLMILIGHQNEDVESWYNDNKDAVDNAREELHIMIIGQSMYASDGLDLSMTPLFLLIGQAWHSQSLDGINSLMSQSFITKEHDTPFHEKHHMDRMLADHVNKLSALLNIAKTLLGIVDTESGSDAEREFFDEVDRIVRGADTGGSNDTP